MQAFRSIWQAGGDGTVRPVVKQRLSIANKLGTRAAKSVALERQATTARPGDLAASRRHGKQGGSACSAAEAEGEMDNGLRLVSSVGDCSSCFLTATSRSGPPPKRSSAPITRNKDLTSGGSLAPSTDLPPPDQPAENWWPIQPAVWGRLPTWSVVNTRAYASGSRRVSGDCLCV